MNNQKKNTGDDLIIYGIILFFILPPVGIILVIVGVLANKNMKDGKNTGTSYEEDKQFSQEEIHAHDFTKANQDDISQSTVHEHKGWESNDGPIKYR